MNPNVLGLQKMKIRKETKYYFFDIYYKLNIPLYKVMTSSANMEWKVLEWRE